ncbi:MAG TPA: hypothetical protein VL981_02345 [Candidatus Methylacidiphilales bacterium]|nr:hypothetical protein [Candidatus Methylacidiphilales bacterium]
MLSRSFYKSLRAVFERGCLAMWMLLMLVNTVIVGLAAELLIFGVILSCLHLAFIINEQSTPLLVLGVFGVLYLPIVAKFYEYGVENLNFEAHEGALNTLMNPPESWSNVILTFLDETAHRSRELDILVRLIDEAPGPVERQDRRAEAKAWLRENRHKLTDEDKEFVNKYLGYLR